MSGTAMAPVLIGSWRGNETGRERRERAGTGTETETGTGTGRGRERGAIEEIGRDDGPAAQTETKTGENADGVAVAAGNEGVNEETKRGTGVMTEAGRRTGITTKIGAVTGSGPEIRRAGERLMRGDTKMTGTGTGRRGRPNAPAGAEAGRGGTKVVEQTERKRAGKGSAVTAERGTGTETESSVLTNVVTAKRRAIVSESPAMTVVNMNAVGARASRKCPLRAISINFLFLSFLFFYLIV